MIEAIVESTFFEGRCDDINAFAQLEDIVTAASMERVIVLSSKQGVSTAISGNFIGEIIAVSVDVI